MHFAARADEDFDVPPAGIRAVARRIGPLPRELGGALFLTRLLSSFLFEVTPLDPLMLASALLVLDAAAIVAT